MRLFRAPRAGDDPAPRCHGRQGLRRWAPRIIRAVVALLAVCVVALMVVLHSLDRPWLRKRLRAAARASAGLDIDYERVQLGLLSGIVIEGLVVQSPPELRPVAPDLARVGRIDARWHLGSLLGRGPLLDRLAISDVSVVVVIDEHGRTSIDAIPSTGPAPPPSAPVPLSRQAADVLGTTLPVAALEIGEATVTLVRTKDGSVAERTALRGISAALRATPAPPSARGTRALVTVGSPETPLDLEVARTQTDGTQATARAKLSLTLEGTSSAAALALDVRMVDQTFARSISADHWLHAEARARFDPGARRTEITIDHTQAGDGAANVEASVEVPDQGDPLVRHAQGDLDLARILGWIPAGVAPVSAEKATTHFRVDALVAASVPHLAEGGSALVEADAANVGADLPGGPVRVGKMTVSVHAQPAAGGGLAGKGSIALAELLLTSGKTKLVADDVALDFEGQQGADGVVSGRGGFRFHRIKAGGSTAIGAGDGRLDLDVAGLVPATDDPLKTRGDVTLSLKLASFDVQSPGARVLGEGLSLRTHVRLEGHAPYAIELDAPVARLRLLARDGGVLADAPAQIKAALHGLVPNLAQPDASRGTAKVTVTLGEAKVELEAINRSDRGDAVDFSILADVPSLKVARPFLPASLAKDVPWDQVAVSVRSTGRVEGLHGTAPRLQQTTTLDVQRPAFENVAARAVSLTLRSTGGALEQQADADLRVQALAIDGGTPGDEHMALSAMLDREHPSLRLQLATDGRAATKVSAALSFDPARRAVPYEIHAHLAGLAPLTPLVAKIRGLEGFDLSVLELGLTAKGTLLGLVAAVGRDGALRLEATPTRTVAVEGSADVRVAQFHWSRGDNAAIVPAVVWHGTMHGGAAHRTIDSHLEVDALHLDLGPKDVDLTKIRDDSSVTVSGDLLDPETAISQRASVAAVKQDFVPEYPIGDFTLGLAAERDREGLVHVTELKVANGAGGTTLGLSGNVEVGVARRRLSVTTSLGQNLERLATIPSRFTGHGEVGLEATVTSPDLGLFRVRATLKGENVSVRMPKQGIEVETANGQVPITVALEVGKDGVSLRPDEKRSHYSMLRFADQHPLLSRSGFLSIASLKTPFATIAPLVGNLEIEQNFVSLRQFEMGVRGGSITGQCGLDWEGPKSTVELHVRATGVQSSHGEPFDGNIAVVVAAGDRTVEGRAEILRIGERHLLDLLDMQDPLHVDPAMNRIRTALVVGYPDRLLLVFDHGFASARLELGGIARLISIGELRGIPMGPIVDKFLAPILDPNNAKDAP